MPVTPPWPESLHGAGFSGMKILLQLPGHRLRALLAASHFQLASTKRFGAPTLPISNPNCQGQQLRGNGSSFKTESYLFHPDCRRHLYLPGL